MANTETTTVRYLHVDSFGTLHASALCSELHQPHLGSMRADCESARRGLHCADCCD